MLILMPLLMLMLLLLVLLILLTLLMVIVFVFVFVISPSLPPTPANEPNPGLAEGSSLAQSQSHMSQVLHYGVTNRRQCHKYEMV